MACWIFVRFNLYANYLVFIFFDACSERFGMYNVNFNDPQRKRTAKKSVAYLRNIIETRRLPGK